MTIELFYLKILKETLFSRKICYYHFLFLFIYFFEIFIIPVLPLILSVVHYEERAMAI